MVKSESSNSRDIRDSLILDNGVTPCVEGTLPSKSSSRESQPRVAPPQSTNFVRGGKVGGEGRVE